MLLLSIKYHYSDCIISNILAKATSAFIKPRPKGRGNFNASFYNIFYFAYCKLIRASIVAIVEL